MLLNKPKPVQIGNRYYYTLSSYEPATVEVFVMRITKADVERSFNSVVERHGGNPKTVDNAWIAEHFEGISSISKLKASIRKDLERASSTYAEEQKSTLCARELASRLKQSVPKKVISAVEETLRLQLTMELEQQGLTMEDFQAQTGADKKTIENGIKAQAQDLAEQFAALEAYAQEKDISVADEEIPSLLMFAPEETEEIMKRARDTGALESLRISALRAKANRDLVAESSCSYRYETAQQAAEREEAFRDLG